MKRGETPFSLVPTYSVRVKILGNIRPDTIYYNGTHKHLYPYIPTVQLCPLCARQGHRAETCTSTLRCGKCSGTHLKTNCPINNLILSERKCPNCRGNHNAGYGGCPYIKHEQEVINISIQYKISSKAAREAIANNHFPDTPQEINRNTPTYEPNRGGTLRDPPLNPMTHPTTQVLNLQTNTQDILHYPTLSSNANHPTNNTTAQNTTQHPQNNSLNTTQQHTLD